MRAVIFHQFKGELSVEHLPDPTPASDGVVVSVQRTGICRSDWHGWQGHDSDVVVPHVPGHELAGEVVAVGADVRRFRVGDRVTVPFVSGCGRCPPCGRGDPQVCDAQFQPGFTAWGSFAEHVALRYADLNLVRLPDSVTYAAAASLGCRFTTAYRAIVQLAELKAGESVAIFGCGGVGLSAIMIAHALGARAIAIDIDPAKLALARELGATSTLNAGGQPDVSGAVRELTLGGADVSIDALGSELTLRQSLGALRKRGRHVQVGLLVGEPSDPRVPMSMVVGRELALFGSHGIASIAYGDVFDLIERRAIPLERMVERTLPLEAVPARLRSMASFAGVGISLVDPVLA
jgi:alcohol dehydrogenase